MADICHVWSAQLLLTSEHKETPFYYGGAQTLEQVAQVGYGVPINQYTVLDNQL